MQITQEMMGMHVTVDVRDGDEQSGCNQVMSYLRSVDKRFSTYKPESEISKINRGELSEEQRSADMREIFQRADETKKATAGYFDMYKTDGTCDPSGIVKGWAIWKSGELLKENGHEYYFVDAGGDIQAHVANPENQWWRVGIRNPFKREEIVKVLQITNEGVATSGSYERGSHIYNPLARGVPIKEVVSITIIGPNVYEADRFATAAFAMGPAGIQFIEELQGFEGYVISDKGIATMTSGFQKYIIS